MSSLYDRLGGKPAMSTAVDIFYDKLLADQHVARFFDSVDMDRQRRKQQAFLTMACGGPPRYDGKTMAKAHAPLLAMGLDDTHVDSVAGHLQATLEELGVEAEDVTSVIELVESLRSDVLGRSPASE